MAAVVRPTAALASGLQQQATDLEAFVRGSCSDRCAEFVAAWTALKPLRRWLPQQLVGECTALRARIKSLAGVAGGLQAGTLELCAWQRGDTYAIGVVRAGTVPRGDDMGWVLVPVIVVGIAAVGVWVLVDLWLTARQLEAQAQIKRAELAAAAQQAITLAPPDQRAALASAMAQANQSIAVATQTPDWLTRVGNVASQVASSLFDGVIPWLMLAALMLWGGGTRR